MSIKNVYKVKKWLGQNDYIAATVDTTYPNKKNWLEVSVGIGSMFSGTGNSTLYWGVYNKKTKEETLKTLNAACQVFEDLYEKVSELDFSNKAQDDEQTTPFVNKTKKKPKKKKS